MSNHISWEKGLSSGQDGIPWDADSHCENGPLLLLRRAHRSDAFAFASPQGIHIPVASLVQPRWGKLGFCRRTSWRVCAGQCEAGGRDHNVIIARAQSFSGFLCFSRRAAARRHQGIEPL